MKKVKEGYKMSELGEIPIEWQIKSINDICYVNPDTLSNKSDDSLSLEYIDIESVTTRRINEIKKLEFKDAPSRARRLIKRNDVIMSTVRPYLKAFAKINIEKDNLVCSTGFAVLRAKKNINHEFLFQSILSDYYIQQLSNKMVGSNYPAVNSSDVRESNIILPPLEEQEKIASILSTVDEQIDNVDALIEKNKELKKGLMQTLLTKGIGHTKFKKTDIGEIPEEWELFLLENVTERMIVGLATSVTEYYRESGIPIIRNMNIKNGYFDDSSMLYLDEKFANSMLGKTVKTNDVITVHTGSNIGLTCVVPKEYNEAHTFTTLITTTKRNLLNPEYLMYSINSEYGVNEINRLQVGGGKSNLNVKEFKLYRIAVPPIEEQEKIVSILKEVDKKINKYSKKKQLLEQVKKGLMQQLLTGNIRV